METDRRAVQREQNSRVSGQDSYARNHKVVNEGYGGSTYDQGENDWRRLQLARFAEWPDPKEHGIRKNAVEDPDRKREEGF